MIYIGNLNVWTDSSYLLRENSSKFHFAKNGGFWPLPAIELWNVMKEQFNRLTLFCSITQNVSPPQI